MERKMAVVKRIDKLEGIPDAEFIEVAHVGGWKVVVKKGEHEEGSLVVYCEIDSFIPTALAPFLTKAGHFPKEYKGVLGERLKTVKLRGQLSQGLILPVSTRGESGLVVGGLFGEGDDVSEFLGISKWEAPEEAGRASEAKGNFPHFIKKTDQERVENIKNISEHWGESFEVTIKLDGSSCSAYHFNGQLGVCSRNIELKEVCGNAFWDIVRRESILEKIQSTGRNLAVQGELTAPNIQKNHNKETKPQFHCFNIFDIDRQEYLLPRDRQNLCEQLDIPHVKILDSNFVLSHTVEQILELSEGAGDKPEVKHREGLVFKSNIDSRFSFKAVSHSYLLRTE